MARLPQAQDMGARPGLYVGGAGPRDRSGEILDQGIQQLANTAFQVADGMKKREDAFAYSSAKSEFLLADIEARRSLVGDPDWKTHEKKYQDKMRAATDKLAATITSPHDRQLFGMDTKVGLAQGSLAVGEAARKMEVDQGRATINAYAAKFRNAYVNPAATQEDRTNILSQFENILQDGLNAGYINQVEREALGKEHATDYVLGALEAMADPADALALLKASSKGQPRFMATEDVKGLVQAGNININDRPNVQNADGTGSSVFSASFEEDGKEVLVPRVSEDGRIMSEKEAWDQYRKTGRHLGKFDSVAAANAYANDLHLQQERDSGKRGNMTDILDADVKQKLIDAYGEEVKLGSIKTESFAVSDSLYKKHPDDPGAALKAAENKSLYTGNSEEVISKIDAAKIRLAAKYDQAATLKKQTQSANLELAIEDVYRSYEETGTASLYDIDSGVLEKMGPEGRRAIEQYIANPSPAKSDQSAWNELYQMRVHERKKFNDVDMNLYKGKLTDADWKGFVAEQDTPDGGIEDQYALTGEQAMSDAAFSAGLDPANASEKNDDGKKVRAFNHRFRTELNLQSALWQSDPKKGRPLNSEEMKQIGDRLALEVVKEINWGLDDERPAWAAEVEGVPQNMVDELAWGLKLAGKPVTDVMIQEAYKLELQRDKDRKANGN